MSFSCESLKSSFAKPSKKLFLNILNNPIFDIPKFKSNIIIHCQEYAEIEIILRKLSKKISPSYAAWESR
jgi:hypothetical protein